MRALKKCIFASFSFLFATVLCCSMLIGLYTCKFAEEEKVCCFTLIVLSSCFVSLPRGTVGWSDCDIVFCLFVWILYVPSTIFQLHRGGSSWVELVLS